MKGKILAVLFLITAMISSTIVVGDAPAPCSQIEVSAPGGLSDTVADSADTATPGSTRPVFPQTPVATATVVTSSADVVEDCDALTPFTNPVGNFLHLAHKRFTTTPTLTPVFLVTDETGPPATTLAVAAASDGTIFISCNDEDDQNNQVARFITPSVGTLLNPKAAFDAGKVWVAAKCVGCGVLGGDSTQVFSFTKASCNIVDQVNYEFDTTINKEELGTHQSIDVDGDGVYLAHRVNLAGGPGSQGGQIGDDAAAVRLTTSAGIGCGVLVDISAPNPDPGLEVDFLTVIKAQSGDTEFTGGGHSDFLAGEITFSSVCAKVTDEWWSLASGFALDLPTLTSIEENTATSRHVVGGKNGASDAYLAVLPDGGATTLSRKFTGTGDLSYVSTFGSKGILKGPEGASSTNTRITTVETTAASEAVIATIEIPLEESNIYSQINAFFEGGQVGLPGKSGGARAFAIIDASGTGSLSSGDKIIENPSSAGTINAIDRNSVTGNVVTLGDGSSLVENTYGPGGPDNVPEFSLTTMLMAVLISGFVLMFVIRRRK